MKKMIIQIILFPCTLLISQSKTLAQNWVPLEIGNKCQYFGQIYYYSTPWPSLTNVEVYADTLINGKIFYWRRNIRNGYWPNIDSTLQRYDLENNLLYSFNFSSDSEYVYMDFNLEAGDTVEILQSIGRVRIVVEGSDFLFEDIVQYKGHKTYDWTLYGSYAITRYSIDFGNYYGYSWNHVPGVGEYDTDSHLIQSIINTNDTLRNHSHQYFPMITFIPVTQVSDSLFHTSFYVNHYYSRKFIPYGGNDSLLFNYIDTVVVESFYYNGIVNINNSPNYISNAPNEQVYVLDTVLNLSLLKNGYNFYYRIKAIDKGIIPHTTFSPSSGYYEAVYDTTTGINDINELLYIFQLSQNYPNPFNPVTTIKYTIPNVTLSPDKIGKGSRVALKVYDILGKEIASLVNEEQPAGNYEIKFDSHSGNVRNLASGIYFYRLQAGNFNDVKKMVYLK